MSIQVVARLWIASEVLTRPGLRSSKTIVIACMKLMELRDNLWRQEVEGAGKAWRHMHLVKIADINCSDNVC